MDQRTTQDTVPWHRLFGLLLSDYLSETPFSVELEMDLSQRKQLLDIIVVRKRPGTMHKAMPDGFEDLADHNLISFKSFQETLDDWALKELTGHYVNYRKQTSPKGQLLSEGNYRLYAVTSRYPRELFKQVANRELRPGVYDCSRGSDVIRIVVINHLAEEARNALLHLFSAIRSKIEYGAEHYEMQSNETSSLVDEVFGQYREEGKAMPYTMEDFRKYYEAKYTLKERLSRMGIDQDEVISSAPKEQLLKHVSKEDILKHISRKDIEAYLKSLKKSSPKRKTASRKKKA
jgi:hypothetical protein